MHHHREERLAVGLLVQRTMMASMFVARGDVQAGAQGESHQNGPLYASMLDDCRYERQVFGQL